MPFGASARNRPGRSRSGAVGDDDGSHAGRQAWLGQCLPEPGAGATAAGQKGQQGRLASRRTEVERDRVAGRGRPGEGRGRGAARTRRCRVRDDPGAVGLRGCRSEPAQDLSVTAQQACHEHEHHQQQDRLERDDGRGQAPPPPGVGMARPRRQPASCPQVLLSTISVELQLMPGIWPGCWQTTSRHTTSVVPCTCALHCP